MQTSTHTATALGDVINREYQAGGDEKTLRNVAHAIRYMLPENERDAFTDAVEMAGLWLED